MPKPKTKTRISAFVAQELGEWLRAYAFKSRQSQGEIVREALSLFRYYLKKKGKA